VFARAKEGWLRRFLTLPHGIPSHDTIARVFARIDPQALNGTNRMQLTVDGDPETGATVLIAILDNLGKGASGAAVQNLNIMLGLAEAKGL